MSDSTYHSYQNDEPSSGSVESIMKFVPVLIILCLCHGSCMSNEGKDRASTTQGGKTQDHWTWRITKRPSQSSDGFVHLVSAIEEMRNGQKQESVNEDTIEGILKVADCMLFEGKPNRLYAFGEEYSDRLVGDASEVLFSDLISLGKYSASQGARLLAEERFEEASGSKGVYIRLIPVQYLLEEFLVVEHAKRAQRVNQID